MAVVGRRNARGEIKAEVLASLLEQGVFGRGEFCSDVAMLASVPVSVPAVVSMAGLTFEQQRELLVLQFEQEL